MHCRNWRDRPERQGEGEGCPVHDLHILLDQYHACDAEPSIDPGKGGLAVTKFVLDFLIENDGVDGYDCSMFVPEGAERPDPNQLDLMVGP